MELLPLKSLVQTSEVDHADWNYKPFLGFLQRTRFKLVASLLRDYQVRDILEIGYGSGVFFPHLKQHCENIYGVDIHTMVPEVQAALADNDLSAELHACSVTEMPLADDSVDLAVAVSALEYVDDIDQACREIIRVLRKDGELILVTPGQSPILDFGLRLLGGEDADENYGDRRQKLLAGLQRHFTTERLLKWPWPGIPWFTMYRAVRLKPLRPA